MLSQNENQFSDLTIPEEIAEEVNRTTWMSTLPEGKDSHITQSSICMPLLLKLLKNYFHFHKNYRKFK